MNIFNDKTAITFLDRNQGRTVGEHPLNNVEGNPIESHVITHISGQSSLMMYSATTDETTIVQQNVLSGHTKSFRVSGKVGSI